MGTDRCACSDWGVDLRLYIPCFACVSARRDGVGLSSHEVISDIGKRSSGRRCMSRSTHFGNGVLGDVLSRRLAQLVLQADVNVVFDLYLSISLFGWDRLRTGS
jgi:hypothetical protein